MAGKNEVTLTFAGDSKQLERTMDNIGSGARDLGRNVDDQAGKLDRVGEAGGTAETRFLGLGAGISGVSTLMSGDAGPEDYAMAFADLGDSIEHTVIPVLKSVGGQIMSTGRAAITSAAQHVAGAAQTVAGWVMMGVQATVNAAKMAVAWLISLGPIALVIVAIGAVIGILAALGVGFDDLKRWAETAWNFILGAIQGVWNWISANWPLLLAILTGPIGLAVLAIVRHKDSIVGAFRAAFDFVKGAASGAKDWIVSTFNGIVSFFADIPGRVAGIFTGLGSSIVSGIKSLWNSTIGGFGFTFGGFDPPGPGSIPGFDFRIPYLHTGGTYKAPPGQREGLAMLLDGERVTRPGAPAGTVVNVYVQGSIRSDRELVKVIRDEFDRGGFG